MHKIRNVPKFASLVGDPDILSRYAKGKEREPHLPIDPDLQTGRPGGSGLDAGPVGIYVEGEGENDYCQNKGYGTAAKDKKDFFHLRIHERNTIPAARNNCRHFLRISASIQSVNPDFTVSLTGVHVKRLSSHQNITFEV